MVFRTADFDGIHFVDAGDAAQEWPEAFAEFGSDLGAAIFRAEDAVEIGADVGHAGEFSRPFGTAF